MKFAITNASGANQTTAVASYDSLEQASHALGQLLGWPAVYLGPGYTTHDGASQVWCAYRTQEERDADAESRDGPRITRTNESAR